MKFSVNLNPHREKKTKISTGIVSSVFEEQDSKESIVAELNKTPNSKFIVHVKPQSGKYTNLVLLRKLEHFFGKTYWIGQRSALRHKSIVIPAAGLGFAVHKKTGKLNVVSPGRVRLPLGYRWIMDPELDSPFDRIETKLGEHASILCLCGHQLSLIQDEQLNVWPVTQGIWLVVRPAIVLSIAVDPIEMCTPATSFGEPHGYSTYLRREQDNIACANLLYVPYKTVAIVRADAKLNVIESGMAVITKPDVEFVEFISLSKQNSHLEINVNLSSETRLAVDLQMDWQVTDPLTVVANIGVGNPNRYLKNVLSTIVLKAISVAPSFWITAEHSRSLYEYRYLEKIQEFCSEIDNQFAAALERVGLQLVSIAWSPLRILPSLIKPDNN